jgi:hypothetical protein
LRSAGEKVQEPVVATAVNTQFTGVPLAGVAVRVTVAPTVNPERSKVGVLSAVVLSVGEDPVSEASAKSGALGVDGFVVKLIVETSDAFVSESFTIT